jgi:hypothetical protein
MSQATSNAPTAQAYSRGPAWGNTASTTTTPASKLLPAGPACQPCPDCGGLNCLCRPRFFAGQLLTEQDLNRLDQYIVAKNQLHNRYLVGEGVVCGLEVQCSPCANTVSVSAGYAIDTCGNDIIVCSPDTVDICKLIAACTPSTAVNCAPYKDTTRCKDLEQEWILTIRYQEVPSRGTTALTGSAQCSCGSGGACGCGSAVSKACGCGSMMPAASCCGQTVSKTTQVNTSLPRRGAPPSCEPTVTCEAYRYEVFLLPDPPAPARGDTTRGIAALLHGEMFERIACCLKDLVAAVTQPAQQSRDQTLLQQQTAESNACCNLRLALLDYVQAHGGTNCRAAARLRAIVCPTPDREGFDRDLANARLEIAAVIIDIVRDCICSAALPPCPMPGDPRVPLASVRVRSSDCTILSVCDWTPLRKNVVTVKTLGYWLGWLPFVPMLRDFMVELCCRGFRLHEQLSPTRDRADAASGVAAKEQVAGAAPAGTVNAGNGLDTPISFGARSYAAGNPISEAIIANLAGGQNPVNASMLLQTILSPVDTGATAAQLVGSPHAQVLAEIARPLVSAFGPLLSAATGGLGRQSDALAAEAAAMRSELDTLKTTVSAQQAALEALRSTPPAPPAAPPAAPPQAG